MSRFSRFMPAFLVAFLGGVFVESVFHFHNDLFIFLAIIGISAGVSAWSARSSRMFFVAIVCLGLLSGAYRFSVWDMSPLDPVLEAKVGAAQEYKGVVSDEPDIREGNVHLTITLTSLQTASNSQVVFGKVLVIVPRFPEYRFNDELLISGIMKHPQVLTEKDGRVFDYPSYLRSKGIRYQMLFPHMTKVGEGKSHQLTAGLFFIKAKFTDAIGYALPSPHSALLSGLLLGGKQSLGQVWLDRFRTAGIIHIIVLSGYNMTLVSEWLVVAFRFLGFYGSLSAGGIGILLFAILTGGGATVMRSAIMAILVLVSKATGRNYDMGRALLVAGVLMVLQNPSILLYDPSFQLSFLASLGLIFISPIVDRRTALFKKMPMWREVFVSTLATQIMVLPLLLSQTGMFSLVALPVNLLVLPVIPLTMLLGFIAAIATLILPFLGVVISFPAYIFLSWILNIADYVSRIPYAAIAVTSITPNLTFGLYVILAVFIYLERQYLPRAKEDSSPAQPLSS